MEAEKNGGRLFRRPKLTLSCSAVRKEGRKEGRKVFSQLSLELATRTTHNHHLHVNS
jgi:hypothetical protein